MDQRRTASNPDPSDYVRQCAKLGEGYDQQHLVSTALGGASLQLQAAGAELGQAALSKRSYTVTDKRDNMALVRMKTSSSSATGGRLRHWEGFGGFNPARTRTTRRG